MGGPFQGLNWFQEPSIYKFKLSCQYFKNLTHSFNFNLTELLLISQISSPLNSN